MRIKEIYEAVKDIKIETKTFEILGKLILGRTHIIKKGTFVTIIAIITSIEEPDYIIVLEPGGIRICMLPQMILDIDNFKLTNRTPLLPLL